MGVYFSGRLDVTVAGTQERLATGVDSAHFSVAELAEDGQSTKPPMPVKKLTVTADDTNTGVIVLGGPRVVASAGSRQGMEILYPGESVTDDYDDFNALWIDAVVNGDGVSFGGYFEQSNEQVGFSPPSPRQ